MPEGIQLPQEPRIQMYFHCKKCQSGQLAVGWTVEGVQVFCESCHLSVVDLDFLGQKVGLYGVHNEEDL